MESSLIVTITDGNFQTVVMESELPVLVDFWAPWCGPCVALGPVLEKIAEARKGKIVVGKVNVEDNPALATQFNIRNIPFMMLIQNGKKVYDLVGNQPEKKILEAIDKLKITKRDKETISETTPSDSENKEKSKNKKSDEGDSDKL